MVIPAAFTISQFTLEDSTRHGETDFLELKKLKYHWKFLMSQELVQKTERFVISIQRQ